MIDVDARRDCFYNRQPHTEYRKPLALEIADVKTSSIHTDIWEEAYFGSLYKIVRHCWVNCYSGWTKRTRLMRYKMKQMTSIYSVFAQVGHAISGVECDWCTLIHQTATGDRKPDKHSF